MSDWRGLPIYSGVKKDSEGGRRVTASRLFPGPPRIRTVAGLESRPGLSVSLAGSYRLCLTYHLCLSPALALLPSLSGPGCAKPRAWVTGRQGACCLFSALTGSRPSRAAVQESSSCSAPATRPSHHQPLHRPPPPRHILSRAGSTGGGRAGGHVPARLQLQDSPSWWPCSPPVLAPNASPPCSGLRSS